MSLPHDELAEKKRRRHIGKLVAGGNNPSEIARLFDIPEAEVIEAAEQMMSGDMDILVPLTIGEKHANSKYLIFNHYSGWMIIEWNQYNSRWMDLSHVQVVEDEAIVIAYRLPRKPL